MTEHIPTPLDTRRLVTKYEELRRKREGTWDPTTMVSETSQEGAALRAHRASPDKVADAQSIAIEPLKNETPPKFKAGCKFTTEKPRGVDEDYAGLVEIPAGDRSPPPEPTSLPTKVTATVKNGTTKAELLRGTKATTSEADGPKAETTPLRAMGRERGRRRGRQLSPERMRIVLDRLRERPILSDAATKAGIHRKTLEYWLKRSEAGDDGYDLEWRGETARFHEHCESAIGDGNDELVLRLVDIAMGGVIYKTDQSLVDRGFRGPDAYLLDANGIPVVETIRNPNGKMLRFLLEWLRPEKWGKHRKIDVPQTGGVLVVGGIPHDIPNKVNNGTVASVKARKWKAGLRMLQGTEV